MAEYWFEGEKVCLENCDLVVCLGFGSPKLDRPQEVLLLILSEENATEVSKCNSHVEMLNQRDPIG